MMDNTFLTHSRKWSTMHTDENGSNGNPILIFLGMNFRSPISLRDVENERNCETSKWGRKIESAVIAAKKMDKNS